ncbi:unnamed protein product (macronuclear) [Paramecium tetraurelia]|uniref:Centrosomal protein of 44 kDa n=1 Tax=Paramecium tetraurelia TaxID=5888 RepID=A0BDV7_PARTE|nr:uncharacterized protein GSPATT00027754001 [Paramecium tetraurelia]CAK56724.1 unnamed protein product [Paramecium tetraurelia]|eukprot:XP_001424122.1 hypothetical protein (macronuclear) [Paramecium tetraurelia strain d4-2]
MSSDLQNQYENFKKTMKKAEYKEQFAFEYVKDNNPTFFLRILHYILIEYNSSFYKSLVDKGYELYSKNDLRFTEQVFKMLQLEFNYKSSINIAQFLSEQYLEHKLILINDIFNEVLQRTKKEKKVNVFKGQENSSYIQNTQNIQNTQKQQESNNKQKPQVFVQRENFQSEDDEEDIEQPKRPEPYKITQQNELAPRITTCNQEQYQLLEQQCNYTQQCIYAQQYQQQPSPPQSDDKNDSQNEIQAQQSFKQKINQVQQSYQTQPNIQVQQNYQTQQNNSAQQQNGVSHQDLQKLMQVILLSNDNIKSVMQKFSELQTTVNMALTNFDQRLTRLELKIRDQ